MANPVSHQEGVELEMPHPVDQGARSMASSQGIFTVSFLKSEG